MMLRRAAHSAARTVRGASSASSIAAAARQRHLLASLMFRPVNSISSPSFSRLFSTDSTKAEKVEEGEFVEVNEETLKSFAKQDEAAEASALEALKTIPAAKPKGKGESLAFQTETKQILDIMANSLYTDQEVFLRELISNASDALEKARYLSSTNNNRLRDPEVPLEIRVVTDPKNNQIIIQDTGIGMNKEELISHLGTIARSGSKAFVKELNSKGESSNNNIIGQFGVGFYSSFMVGEKVEVISQTANPDGSPISHVWTSDGSGSYEITEIEPVSRGTTIKIHLREKCKEFSEVHTIEGIIKKYSNFVGFPIYLNDQRINTVGAVWLQSKDSVTEEQHQDFYRYIANAYDTPTYRLHFETDAPIAINALFYFPETHMEKYGMGRMETGAHLYCRKVLIKHKCKEILPEWLRFVKGVADSEDIPLNISRENMQDSKLIQKINSILTRKILRFLEDEARNNPEKFAKWYEEFGMFLKEGVCTDFRLKSDIARLLRFDSSTGRNTTLDEYVGRMPPTQKAIYYLCAPSRQFAESSPYYEILKKKNIEVLFCYQQIDEFVMQNLESHNKRKIVSIESGAVELEDDSSQVSDEQLNEQYKDLLSHINEVLKDRVQTVKASRRLTSTPAIIVDHESAAVRKLMKFVEQGNSSMRELSKQKLEINPTHSIFANLLSSKDSNPELSKLVIEQVYDNALIAADMLDNPRTMLTRINTILEATLKAQSKKE